MKRSLSLLMAVLMVMTLLSACGGSSNQAASQPETKAEEPKAEEPKAEAPQADAPKAEEPKAEETASGPDRSKRIKIGFAISNFENENFAYMDKMLAAYCEENNIEYVTREHNSQSTAIMEILENFGVAGMDGIIFQNSEPASVQATLDDLAEKGVKVVSYDADVENVTGCWVCSNYATGQVIGNCAADFINNELGGVCDYVVMNSQVVFMQERIQGIYDTLEEKCPNATMVYTDYVLLSGVLPSFQAALAKYPNIQVYCTGYSAAATVVIDDWMPELVRKGADLNKYGVFTCDCTNKDLEYMNETRQGKNILRSTVDLGLKVFVPIGMITQLEGAIRGFETEYTERVQEFPYNAVTFENLDETAAKYGVELA